VADKNETQDQPAKPKHHYNLVVRIGIWITVISAAIWAGGVLIKTIEQFLPYALGLGVLVMAIGLFIQFRAPKSAE
jgi:hypothetical protein